MSDTLPERKIKFNPKKRHEARVLLTQALYEWTLSANDLDVIHDQYTQKAEMKKADQTYFSELLYAISNEITELDKIYETYLDRKLAEITPIELTILRLSTYELFRRTDIPEKVIINEGVELAKMFGANDGHKYVNGILDKVAKAVR